MNKRPDWDQYFMTMAYLVASRSTDESTHAGAVIVRKDNSIVSTGYNGPVRGMDIEDVPQTRPEKYFYMEHAERNAIFAAARNEGGLDGCRLYVNFLPCADCARAIIQVGITEVIVHKEGQEAFDIACGKAALDKESLNLPGVVATWDASHEATMKIFDAGEKVVQGWHEAHKFLRWWSGTLNLPTGFFRGNTVEL